MHKIIFIFSLILLFNQNVFTQANIKDRTIFTVPIIDCGICNGKAISLPIPNKVTGRVKKIFGTVNVLIYIDDEGNVEDAQSVSGHPLLRKYAEDAALKARFNPFKVDGKVAFAKGTLVYNFENHTGQIIVEGEKVIRRGIINGSATSLPIPEYPKEARERCIGGTVNIHVEVDGKMGSVISAKPIKGNYLLYESSIEAAKNAKFMFFNETSINVEGIIVYNFDSFVRCIETEYLINSKATKLPKPNIKSYLQQNLLTLEKPQNISVQVIINVANGKVLSAKAQNGNALLRLILNKSARESDFSPSNINGQPIYAKGILIYKVRPNGEVDTNVSDEIIYGEPLELPKARLSGQADLKSIITEEVLVEVEINEKGIVTSAKAIEGHPLLRPVSVSAARRARFTSTYENEKRVVTIAKILYNFLLADRYETEVEVQSINVKKSKMIE